MSSNEILQQIMEKVMQAIAMCQGEQAMEVTAYQVEKNLLRQLLSLGKSLLQLYFQSRASRVRQGWQINQAEKKVRYHSQKKRRYLSLFGEIEIERPYYYSAGEAGHSLISRGNNVSSRPKAADKTVQQDDLGNAGRQRRRSHSSQATSGVAKC